MVDKIVLPGAFTDLTSPEQLGELNLLLNRMLALLNVFDPASFALSWLEGAAAGQVIASNGILNAPVWSASPTLTGATVSGLTASHTVFTDAAKALTSIGTVPVEHGGTGAATLADNGVLYGNATAAIGATAEGATGTVLVGTTANPPAFSADPIVTTVTASGLNKGGSGWFGGATHYSEFTVAGTYLAHGNGRVYRYDEVPISPWHYAGATKPTYTAVGNYQGFAFTIGDDGLTSYLHNYYFSSGAGLVLMVLWYCNEAYATGNGEVRWQATYSCCPAGEVVTGPTHTGTLDSGDININATANKLMNSQIGIIPNADLSYGDYIGLTISRIALVGGNNPVAEPVIVGLYMIYVADKLGQAL